MKAQSAVVDVIVPAAGVGSRMGASVPKQYLNLSDNITIIEATLNALHKCVGISKLIVAISPEDKIFKTLPCASLPKVITVFGGRERSDTVRLALSHVETPYVMVHDAARPFISVKDLESLLELCHKDVCGGILASPVADTLKQAFDGIIKKTVDRSCLYRALTPQLFKTSELLEALNYAKSKGFNVTDEASALELMGAHPVIVKGESTNFKITHPEDLNLARALYKFKENLQ